MSALLSCSLGLECSEVDGRTSASKKLIYFWIKGCNGSKSTALLQIVVKIFACGDFILKADLPNKTHLMPKRHYSNCSNVACLLA